MRVYLLMRNGIHLCSNRTLGPLPPVQDLTFRFGEYAGDYSWWRVLHATSTCFIVEAEAPETYCNEWLFSMPHALTNSDFIKFMYSLNDAAVRNSGSLSDTYSRTIYESLGYSTDEDITAVRESTDPLWRFNPEWNLSAFVSIDEELNAGYTP